jgi:hypothetical protein
MLLQGPLLPESPMWAGVLLRQQEWLQRWSLLQSLGLLLAKTPPRPWTLLWRWPWLRPESGL